MIEIKQNVLILGANSAIAKATASLLAQRGYNLFLASRNLKALETFASDLKIRHPQTDVQFGFFDATQYAQHPKFLAHVLQTMGILHGVLLCFGYLGTHALALKDPEESFKILHQNFTGTVSILNLIGDYFSTQPTTTHPQRFILGVSSVSGDRGRKVNYIYSASKSAVNVYLQGLRQHLAPHRVRVVTLKPGYVETPMTEGIHSPLMVSPQYVAKRIAASIQQRHHVYYIPGFWRIICCILKLIPDSLFRHLQ